MLQHRLGLYPISMTALPEDRVLLLLARAGLGVLKIERAEIAGFRISNRVYWATKPAGIV
jgi:hypothetical protein